MHLRGEKEGKRKGDGERMEQRGERRFGDGGKMSKLGGRHNKTFIAASKHIHTYPICPHSPTTSPPLSILSILRKVGWLSRLDEHTVGPGVRSLSLQH